MWEGNLSDDNTPYESLGTCVGAHIMIQSIPCIAKLPAYVDYNILFDAADMQTLDSNVTAHVYHKTNTNFSVL